jgi:hypothetical protein
MVMALLGILQDCPASLYPVDYTLRPFQRYFVYGFLPAGFVETV